MKRRSSHILTAATWLALVGETMVPGAFAQVTPPPGYIYSRHVMASSTQSCLAPAPGGSFVGIGQGFTANGQAVVLAKESGELRLVALGFNSIGDCAYDRTRDVLYVTDNGAELAGSTTGDTVFAIPSASTATGLPAASLELLPAGAVPDAASVAVEGDGNVLVGDATGGTAGTVSRIDVDLGPPAMSFAGGFGFTGGLAVDTVSGDVWVAETISSTFESQISQFDTSGTSLGVFAGPSSGFGSIDLAFNTDGSLLATGAFFGDVVSFDASSAQTAFVSGLTFATGISVDAFTGRVQVLSSTFSEAEEDRSIHRFTPVNRLLTGNGAAVSECGQEFYGLELVAPGPGQPARNAICVDGATCDADGVANDRCLFPVGFCLAVQDPRLAGCLPSPVVGISLTATPASSAVAETAARMQQALPVAAPSCFFSDGIVVPVKVGAAGTSAGRAVVRVKTTLANGKKDADAVTLLCEPA
jgi:hypothetical protein